MKELIDTLWNVNKGRTIEIFGGESGINRYIMECKCNSLLVVTAALCELIDTLWNVNPLTTSLTVPSFSELIDTLWNVKDRT